MRAVVPAGIRYLRLAMCETAADVQELDGLLDAVEAECQIPSHSVKVQCSIETARGVLNAREIVAASSRVISLSFGAEDYTRSMGTSRSKSAQELQFARTYLPVVAAEAGISAIHRLYTPDEEEVAHARQVMEAMRAAEQAGTGVFTVDGKMVDAPVIAKARRVLLQIGEEV